MKHLRRTAILTALFALTLTVTAATVVTGQTTTTATLTGDDGVTLTLDLPGGPIAQQDGETWTLTGKISNQPKAVKSVETELAHYDQDEDSNQYAGLYDTRHYDPPTLSPVEMPPAFVPIDRAGETMVYGAVHVTYEDGSQTTIDVKAWKYLVLIAHPTSDERHVYVNPDQVTAEIRHYKSGKVIYRTSDGKAYTRPMSRHERLRGHQLHAPLHHSDYHHLGQQ